MGERRPAGAAVDHDQVEGTADLVDGGDVLLEVLAVVPRRDDGTRGADDGDTGHDVELGPRVERTTGSMWSAKARLYSTAWTSADRRASHGVLAPAPNSNTLAEPRRSCTRNRSMRSIARNVHQGRVELEHGVDVVDREQRAKVEGGGTGPLLQPPRDPRSIGLATHGSGRLDVALTSTLVSRGGGSDRGCGCRTGG